MNLKKVYRNPEIRKLNIVIILIFLSGIICIMFSNRYICKRMKNAILDRDTVIMAHILKHDKSGGEDNDEYYPSIINYFTEGSDNEEVSEAKSILKTYGYDQDTSIESTKFIKEINFIINLISIGLFIIFIILMYLIYVFLLKKIYDKIDETVTKVSLMSDGKYQKISYSYEEGELSRLVSELNSMGERVNNSILILENEKKNLKDFLSDISHQLKTPLAALIMFNDILKDSEDMTSEERLQFLNKCEEQLSKMQWLIMNLLKVARIEAGVINFEMFSESIDSAINLVVSSLKDVCNKKNQKLIVSGDIHSIIYHDSNWIAEAISNIVKNAIEHTKSGGSIEIKVMRGPLITKIYIIDNGSGIPEDMQKNIFKRFYKGQNTVNPTSIGIGLSLSKSIVEKHKGDIKLKSKEGIGTTFIISLYNSKI